MTNIILIGMMGSGKSTISKSLSKILELPFLDMDDYIEKICNMTISDIFKLKGEEYFREVEKKVLNEIKNMNGYVIATGGGAPTNENFKFLLKNNYIFYLKCSEDTLYRNLVNSISNRPLLDKNSLLKKITEILSKRKEIYLKSSNYVIECDNKNIEDIKKEILNILSIQNT